MELTGQIGVALAGNSALEGSDDEFPGGAMLKSKFWIGKAKLPEFFGCECDR